jgi:hypothetical protein
VADSLPQLNERLVFSRMLAWLWLFTFAYNHWSFLCIWRTLSKHSKLNFKTINLYAGNYHICRSGCNDNSAIDLSSRIKWQHFIHENVLVTSLWLPTWIRWWNVLHVSCKMAIPPWLGQQTSFEKPDWAWAYSRRHCTTFVVQLTPAADSGIRFPNSRARFQTSPTWFLGL